MINLIQQLLFLVIVLCFMIVPWKRALHMFQQNRYETGRYTNWLGNYLKHLKFPVKELIGLVLIGGLFFLDEIYRVVLVGLLAVAFTIVLYLEESKRAEKYIKPLHITSRVKRQMVAMFLLNVMWLVPTIYFMPKIYWGIILVQAYWVNWILLYPMAWVTSPIESLVKNHYIKLAKNILSTYSGKVVGITGSYGKTSCKNILQEILSERFYSLMTPASFNTPMGITITIRNQLKNLHEVFICEMGADHTKDIEKLMHFVQPQYGVVTSIGAQHLQTFKTQENIINEKMKMIEMLPSTGTGVLNKDQELIRNYEIKNTCKAVWYGIEQEDVDYRAIHIVYTKDGSTFTVIDRDQVETEFTTRLLGEHNIANILAAISLGKEMGITYPQLQEAVSKVQYIEHRLQLKKINGYTFIDNAFNSNPVGSSMSLEVLKMMDGKRFVITPGMIDLGPKQDDFNKAFGEKMLDHADVVILVGINQTKSIVDGLTESGFDMDQVHVCKTVKEAFELVYQLATPQDTILLENDLPDAFNQ